MTKQIESFAKSANEVLTQALTEAYEAWGELRNELNQLPRVPMPRLRAFKSPAGDIAIKREDGSGNLVLWVGTRPIVYTHHCQCESISTWLHGGYDPTYIKRMVEMLRAYARYLRKRTEGVYRARAEYLRQKSRAVEWIEGEATLIRLAKEGQ